MDKLLIPQLVPQEFCLKCDLCCRFIEKFSPWSPFILKEEIENFCFLENFPSFIKSYGINLMLKEEDNIYICPLFDKKNNRCLLYSLRPFDCQLYPFVLFYDENYTKVMLGIDSQCPYLHREIDVLNYAKNLKEILESKELREIIYHNPGIIMAYNTNFKPLFILEEISSKIFGECSRGFKLLSLKDKEIFKTFLKNTTGNFAYAFEYIYSWKDIAYIIWKIIDDNLLVFWKQGDSCFLLLPPIGEIISLKALEYSRWILEDRLVIENIGENLSDFFKKNGFRVISQNCEYIYRRKDIVELKGKILKSQRSAYNYFKKNYPVKIRKISIKDSEDCFRIYQTWAKEKLNKKNPDFFILLLEDNFFAQRRLLIDFKELDLEGIVLESEEKIIGYSFGYPLNKENFCVFSEVTDLKYKGISNYVFSEFSKILDSYSFINVMDDSGIKSLRKTKLSYHPYKIRNFYTCQRD